jgi:hypothetical protein
MAFTLSHALGASGESSRLITHTNLSLSCAIRVRLRTLSRLERQRRVGEVDAVQPVRCDRPQVRVRHPGRLELAVVPGRGSHPQLVCPSASLSLLGKRFVRRVSQHICIESGRCEDSGERRRILVRARRPKASKTSALPRPASCAHASSLHEPTFSPAAFSTAPFVNATGVYCAGPNNLENVRPPSLRMQRLESTRSVELISSLILFNHSQPRHASDRRAVTEGSGASLCTIVCHQPSRGELGTPYHIFYRMVKLSVPMLRPPHNHLKICKIGLFMSRLFYMNRVFKFVLKEGFAPIRLIDI